MFAWRMNYKGITLDLNTMFPWWLHTYPERTWVHQVTTQVMFIIKPFSVIIQFDCSDTQIGALVTFTKHILFSSHVWPSLSPVFLFYTIFSNRLRFAVLNIFLVEISRYVLVYTWQSNDFGIVLRCCISLLLFTMSIWTCIDVMCMKKKRCVIWHWELNIH